MKNWAYLFLFLLGLLAVLIPARFQDSPGYMDADYYYLGGYNLASGNGFSEEVLWNYLDDPQGLPNPSFAYWMPLTSLVAALGAWLFSASQALPVDGFPYARLGFILIAGLIPPISAWMAVSIRDNQGDGWLTGLLAVFSGFYLSFLPTTDTFGIYMVLGALLLQLAWSGYSARPDRARARPHLWVPAFLGALAGAMHLARADGLIWLGVAMLAPFLGHTRVKPPTEKQEMSPRARGWPVDLALILLGYMVVMGPWILRNLSIFGTFLSPGGLRTLWLVQYDDLFIYPPELLNPQRWWAEGLTGILQVRAAAFGTNLGTALAVQGLIFLAPLGLLGLWQLRRDLRVKLGVFAWSVTFLAMTVVFPEPGARGGFFHSGAAIQVLIWAVVPQGLWAFVTWVGNLRQWRIAQALRVFQSGLVLLAFGLSAFLVLQRVIGRPGSTGWNASANQYTAVHQALLEMGGDKEAMVLVNNPPGYHLVSGQPAIVIPMGDVETVLSVARRYGAEYLLLEPNHPKPLNHLFENPEGVAGLEYLMTVRETLVFSVD